MKGYIKQQTLYSIRWQLSTPILAIVRSIMEHGINGGFHYFLTAQFWMSILTNSKYAAVANLVGSFIFYWIDRWIFKK